MPADLDITRVTTLDTDNGDAGIADPGDVLRTRVTITNSGDEDTDNTTFSDTFYGSTLLAGSLNVSPHAVNDVFTAVGNTQFLVGGAAATFPGLSASFAGNLLSNDTNFVGDNFPGFTLTSTGTFATTGGGSVVINANGSFAYNPAAGFSGADTFTYTVRDNGQDGIGGNADDLTSTATVTINITVPNTVWYVDQAYDGSNGASDGTSWRPFTSMANVNGAGGAGDVDVAGQTIHVRGNHTVDVVLESGQSLIGNGAALTVGGYNITSAGAANTLTHGTGTGVLLSTNNTLSGFNVAGSNNAGTGIADNNGTVGNLTISNVSITGSGQAIDIDQGGALNVTLDTLSSAGSAAQGVHLQGVSGSFTANGGIIQTSVGQGFLIGAAGGGTASSGGNANITYAGQISSAGGAAVDIQDRSGGTVTFSGNITEGAGVGIVGDGNAGNINFTGQIFINSGTSNAITLTNNSAAINFAPTGNGVDIITNTGNGFVVDGGGGTVTLTGAGNTVATAAGRAVEIDNITIGGGGVTFQSVDVSNGINTTGIFLRNAGSGGFTITGTGTTAGSGGTISSIDSGTDGNAEQGIGIYLENTNNISLSNLAFTGDFANFGIRGTNVNNFTLRDSTTNSASADNGGFGNSNAADEGVISFDNLTGTALFTGNNLSDGHEDIIVIENTSGSLNLTVNDSAANQAVIGRNGEAFGSATGNDGILVTTSGSAALTMTVSGVVFEGWRGDGIQTDATGASTQSVTISNNTFHNAHLDIVSGGGGIFLGLSAGTGAGPNVSYNISGNSFRGAEGNVINISALGPSGAMSGTILNNTIGNNNGVHNTDQANTGSNAGGDGIFVRVEKADGAGTLTSAVRIENNDIGDIVNGVSGIRLLANGGASGAGTARLEATIRNNRIDELGSLGGALLAGIYADVGGAGGSDAARMGLNIENNTVNLTGSSAFAALALGDLTANSQYYFPGYAGPYNDSGLGAFHTGAEGNTFTLGGGGAVAVATAPDIFAGTFATGSNFVLPVPIMAAEPVSIDWEAALRDAQEQAYLDFLAGQAGSGGEGGSGGGETPDPVVVDDGVISTGELMLVVDAAIARWEAAGATEAQLAAMRAVVITVSDLGGLTLGSSTAGTIVVDDDAAGWRWFVDATPGDDSEYAGSGLVLAATDPNDAAATRIDLLTVLMHELGHQIGLEDVFAPGETDELMFGSIRAGERRLPGADDVADATGVAVNGAFAISPMNLGTLVPGQTVTIDWLHTIDAPAEDGLVGGGGQALVDSDQTAQIASLAEVVAVDGLTLGDRVFLDANRNGVFDGGDSGVAGVTLTLYGDTNDNGVYDAGTDLYVGYNELGGGAGYQQGIDTPAAAGTGTALTATTDANGNYSFNFLAPGDYIVVVDAANFGAGQPLEGRAVGDGATDPDDNVDNDNNGQVAGAATATRAIRLDYDQEPTAGAGNDTNNTVDLGFIVPNAAPSSTNLLGDTVTWTEGDAAVALDLGGNATIADGDSANFAGGTLTVAITAGGVAAEDVLAIAAVGTVTFDATTVSVGGTQIATWTGGTGGAPLVFTFDADATPAAVQELVRALTYSNTGGDDPTDGNRTLTWTLVDGDGSASGGADTLIVSTTVNVDPVDDAAVAQPDSVTTAENAVGSGSVFADNGSGADSDVDGPPLEVAEVNGMAANVGTQITLASGALLTVNADGTYSYDPNGQFDYLISAATATTTQAVNDTAVDSFSYTLTGGNSVSVTVVVTGVDGPGDELWGDSGNDVLVGTLGADYFDLSQGGDDTVNSFGGNDAFYFGAEFDANDTVDGSDGINDQIGLEGDYTGANALVLGPTTITNVEVLAVLPGFDYDVTTVDGNVPNGGMLTVFAGNLGAGDNFTFDGSAETDGAYTVYCGQGIDLVTTGAGDDGIYFGPGKFDPANDRVDGGTGTNDQFALDGDYTLTLDGTAIQNIDVIALLAGEPGDLADYDLTLDDTLIGAGGTMTIWGTPLETALVVDGSGESDGDIRIYGGTLGDTLTGGAGDDWFWGGLGGDTIEGGAGADTFMYESADQSNAAGFDRLIGFDDDADQIDLDGLSVSSFAGAVSGTLSAGTIVADLEGAVTALGANQALVFTASAGDMNGRTFLVVDANGTTGYQAADDFLIEIVSPASPIDNIGLFA